MTAAVLLKNALLASIHECLSKNANTNMPICWVYLEQCNAPDKWQQSWKQSLAEHPHQLRDTNSDANSTGNLLCQLVIAVAVK